MTIWLKFQLSFSFIKLKKDLQNVLRSMKKQVVDSSQQELRKYSDNVIIKNAHERNFSKSRGILDTSGKKIIELIPKILIRIRHDLICSRISKLLVTI